MFFQRFSSRTLNAQRHFPVCSPKTLWQTPSAKVFPGFSQSTQHNSEVTNLPSAWKLMDMMPWEHPACCWREVHGSESFLEARKAQPFPCSPSEIPGLAGIVGHGEVNKQAHALESHLWASRHDLCYENATICSSGLICSTARFYLTRDLGCVRSWKGKSHPLNYLEPSLPHLS